MQFKKKQTLLTLIFFLLMSNILSAQVSQKIDLNLENVTIKKFFTTIEDKTDYTFMYKNLDLTTPVTITAKQMDLSDILNQVLTPLNIRYEISGKRIILNKFVPEGSSDQARTISGTVTDEHNDPIIGANVMVKGTTNGVITDIDGNFVLSVPENAVLQISYIGYTTQEVNIGGQTRIEIKLAEDFQVLDEVVVIAYGTTKRRNFTGSVSSLKMEDSPVAMVNNTNALESLKGSITGLDVGASKEAGGTPSMQVRGQSSISGSNDPLVVVDGIIFMGDINTINPSDIATIDVLKDATSSAAYGSRSANGVIMITTKKGKPGKPVINFNTRGTMQTWHLKPELMNGSQYLESVAAANKYTDYSFLVPQEKINYEAGKEINWLDEISRTGWLQDYQVDISGAGEKMNYYLSTSYTDNKGVIKGDEYNRISVLGKINADITSWLQIGLDAAYTRSDYGGVAASVWSASILSPYGMMYRPNGMLEAKPDGTRGKNNPLWGIDDESKKENIDYRDNLRANAYALVKCPWIKGLSYRLNYAGNLNYRKAGDFTHESYSVPVGDYDDDSRYSIATQNSYLSSAGGKITNERETSYVIDNILSYNQSFGKHSIDLTAVATRDYRKFESQMLEGNDFAANGNTVLGLNGLHYATAQKITLNNWKRTNVGYVARGSYSYNDTYYLTGSYRRDGASVFGADNKWGDFGAVGAAWRITNENFMENAGFLNDMKLKLSWGRNGNQGLEQYKTLSKVDNGADGGIVGVFGNTGKPFYGIDQTMIGNSELGWETTEAWNIGFESAWFDNRLFVDLDVYFSRTYDQIFKRTIPVMTGFSEMFASMGEVSNKGVELTVRTTNIRNKDFIWDTGLTFWLNRNKLIHLYGEDLDGDGKEDNDIGNKKFIGESINAIFGYKQDGIVQVTDTEYMEANGVKPGQPKYVDRNKDGIIDSEDRMILGSGDPNFKLNLSNTVQYKNWELYVMIAGVFGGNGYYQAENKNAFITSGDRNWFASNGLYIPYWTEENPTNKYPAATFTGDGYFLGLQSRAYVRLQDLTLSYSFNQPWMKNAGINNFKAFITAKNLATITGWKGGDPESGVKLFDVLNNFPVMTSISLGLKFSF